jgi:hypothetical protein
MIAQIQLEVRESMVFNVLEEDLGLYRKRAAHFSKLLHVVAVAYLVSEAPLPGGWWEANDPPV